jgi:hypothetical protein
MLSEFSDYVEVGKLLDFIKEFERSKSKPYSLHGLRAMASLKDIEACGRTDCCEVVSMAALAIPLKRGGVRNKRGPNPWPPYLKARADVRFCGESSRGVRGESYDR